MLFPQRSSRVFSYCPDHVSGGALFRSWTIRHVLSACECNITLVSVTRLRDCVTVSPRRLERYQYMDMDM